MPTVNIAIEDNLSEAVLTRLFQESPNRPTLGRVFPKRTSWVQDSGPAGWSHLRKSLRAYDAAAAVTPFVVLVDLDAYACPPELVRDWVGGHPIHPNLLLRVATREVEAWLIGDGDGLAEYMHLTRHYFPTNPERIKDPKRYIVRHGARSRLGEVRSDVAPSLASKGVTGPYFTRFLSNFAKNAWDVDAATARCESLRRARAAIARL